EFIPSEIPQSKWSKEMAPPKDAAKKWVKVAKFYDEFITIAIFDVLKYCDEVVVLESATTSARDGLSTVQAIDTARGKVNSNQRQLDFYMLADVRNDEGAALGKDKSAWRFWLELYDGSIIRPSAIRTPSWTPALKRLFGSCCSNFKELHKLEFPLCGSDLEQGRKCRGPIKFVLSCPGYARKIEWMAEQGWSEPALKSERKKIKTQPAPDSTLAKLEVYKV
ncbi:hypothetical protein KAU11_03110, partial [Candidatus Babeliales bacterium]|nr:hypothetical protein [Candidatus Babeliales bacterium]